MLRSDFALRDGLGARGCGAAAIPSGGVSPAVSGTGKLGSAAVVLARLAACGPVAVLSASKRKRSA